MSPKIYQMSSFRQAKQAGFLLPMAIFIILAMGVLALSLTRFTGQSSVAVTQELISAQTFYAAESGVQFAMNQIFFVPFGGAAITRSAADANCLGLNSSTVNFSGAGLNNCSTTLSCSISVDGDDVISFYRLVSVASCGSAPINAQRSIEVSAVIQ